ncbi:related to pyrroline-5-carboxylate reductase [Rhynchosporium secalis]|uniref:Related to pyrroline-5-carboxylate reductase n=1 Tax=Rhynchosporium secalis TaxID=38038 RepID=A0A1E1M6X0_RHYSE|nr:related to pyrroline-5-carboxylate reductase [Rhynchosporium secalis]
MTTNGSKVKTGQTLAVIGCGNMAGAILSGIMASCAKTLSSGAEPRFSHFIATVNSEESAKRLRSRFSHYDDCLHIIKGENVTAMDTADIVLLGFKPYMIDNVLAVHGVREALLGKLVISVLAGSPVEKLKGAIYGDRPHDSWSTPVKEKHIYIKRAMMNVAAEYGESMTVLETNPDIPKAYEELTEWMFSQLGRTAPVAPENYDIAGVMAGASGALLSIAFDGMLDGAVSQGMKRADANKILTQSLISLATLLQNEHPAVLREKISSPKGTTIAGLLSLEEDRARYAFSKATIAASERSKQIGKQA